MRFVYVDESGTNDNQPVTVVVAIVVHADTQIRPVAAYLDHLTRRFIPLEVQEGFIFHAAEIMNGGKVLRRAIWPKEMGLRVLRRVLSIPRKYGLSVCYAYIRNGIPGIGRKARHVLSFADCIKTASDFIKIVFPGEVATVIAEDSREMRDRLARVRDDIALPEGPEELRMHAFDVVQGSVHFAGKNDEPLLQIADACAYAMRRYLAKQEHGDTLFGYLNPDYEVRNILDQKLPESSGYGAMAFHSPTRMIAPFSVLSGETFKSAPPERHDVHHIEGA